MKNIRKITMTALLLIIETAAYSQGCTLQNLPCEYTQGWDWLGDPNNNNGNWDAQLQTGTVGMTSPFYSGTPSTDIVRISDASDYMPSQGWVLLAKDFGCVPNKAVSAALPWFMLYNKYRSIIRLFIYFGNPNPNNKASVVLKWSSLNSSTQNNSLLTLSNSYAKDNSVYPITNNGELILNYLNHTPNSGGWEVTEFQVNFDPNTVISVGNFQRLDFFMNIASSSNVTLTGDFSFSTESATTQEPPAPSTVTQGQNTFYNYLVTGKKFLGRAPKVDDLTSGFSNIQSGADTVNKMFHIPLTRAAKQASEALNNGALKKFLIGTATVAEKILGKGILDLALSLTETFVGKSNEAAATTNNYFVQPTISKGTVKLSGTIVTENNPKTISLQLPGTSHKYSTNGNYQCLGMPIYDCPLGLISVQTLPSIEKITHAIKVGTRHTVAVNNVGGQQPSFTTNDLFSDIKEEYHSYRVTSDFEVALNAAAGANIESVSAALVAIQDVTNQPLDTSYALISDRSSSSGTNLTGYNELTTVVWPQGNPAGASYTRKSLESTCIENGVFILNTLDTTNKQIEYSTPFIDAEMFKNSVIIAQPAMKILFKVRVILNPVDPNADQTPIIYVLTYDLSSKTATAGSTNPFTNGSSPAFTCSQLEKMQADNIINGTVTVNSGTTQGVYLKTNNSVLVNANSTQINNVSFKGGNQVQMTPGFIGQAGGTNYFRAYIDNAGLCQTATNALVVNSYFTNCTASALDRPMGHQGAMQEANEEIHNSGNNSPDLSDATDLKMNVVPNPSDGHFSLLFNKNVEGGRIRIINNTGQEVFIKILDGKLSIFDLNTENILARGNYCILWDNKTFFKTQKIIVE